MLRNLLKLNKLPPRSKISIYLNGFKLNLEQTRQLNTSRHDEQMRTESIKNRENFKILPNSINLSPKYNTPAENSQVELDDLELIVADKRYIFNLTWLRDSCHCVKCTHQYSRQRLFTAKDFKREMFSINQIHLSNFDNSKYRGPIAPKSIGYDDMLVNVKWSDGHDSYYSLNWLKYIDSLYNTSNSQVKTAVNNSVFNFPEDDFYQSSSENQTDSKYWSVDQILNDLKPVDYHDLVNLFQFNNESTFINANRISEMSQKRFDAMWLLSSQLVTYGLAKIINTPCERNQVLNVAKSLAYERSTGYGTVFDVVVEPSEEINLAYSSLEFDLHSDLTYRETSPGVQLLHCIRSSEEGGLSYFSDAFNAANTLKREHPVLFETLVHFPVTFIVRDPYRNIKFRRQQPILTTDNQGKLSDVYYSPFMLPPVGNRDDIKLFYLALDSFTQLLQSKSNKYIAKMNPGDLFIFHNRRVLHGRSAYDATQSSRFLQGCYMDWDEIRCLHEKLHTHRNNTTRGD